MYFTFQLPVPVNWEIPFTETIEVETWVIPLLLLSVLLTNNNLYTLNTTVCMYHVIVSIYACLASPFSNVKKKNIYEFSYFLCYKNICLWLLNLVVNEKISTKK